MAVLPFFQGKFSPTQVRVVHLTGSAPAQLELAIQQSIQAAWVAPGGFEVLVGVDITVAGTGFVLGATLQFVAGSALAIPAPAPGASPTAHVVLYAGADPAALGAAETVAESRLAAWFGVTQYSTVDFELNGGSSGNRFVGAIVGVDDTFNPPAGAQRAVPFAVDTATNVVACFDFGTSFFDLTGNGSTIIPSVPVLTSVADLLPGLRAVLCDGLQGFQSPTTSPLVQLLGPMTVEIILSARLQTTPPDPNYYIIAQCYAIPAIPPDTNTCWSVGVEVATAQGTRLFWFHEGALYFFRWAPSPFAPTHVALVRGFDNSVTLYANGFAVETTPPLVAPTGGSATRLAVASEAFTTNQRLVGSVASLRVRSVAATPQEIRQSYNETLGRALGPVT
jgi:hypothetical protein